MCKNCEQHDKNHKHDNTKETNEMLDRVATEIQNQISEDGSVKPELQDLINQSSEADKKIMANLFPEKEASNTTKLEDTITIAKTHFDNLMRENNSLKAELDKAIAKLNYAMFKFDRMGGALIRLQATCYDTKLDLQK